MFLIALRPRFRSLSYFYPIREPLPPYPLPYIPGIGSQRAELLGAELGIRSVEDLLTHYPFRYIDRSEILSIGMLTETLDAVQIRGVLEPILRWNFFLVKTLFHDILSAFLLQIYESILPFSVKCRI